MEPSKRQRSSTRVPLLSNRVPFRFMARPIKSSEDRSTAETHRGQVQQLKMAALFFTQVFSSQNQAGQLVYDSLDSGELSSTSRNLVLGRKINILLALYWTAEKKSHTHTHTPKKTQPEPISPTAPGTPPKPSLRAATQTAPNIGCCLLPC